MWGGYSKWKWGITERPVRRNVKRKVPLIFPSTLREKLPRPGEVGRLLGERGSNCIVGKHRVMPIIQTGGNEKPLVKQNRRRPSGGGREKKRREGGGLHSTDTSFRVWRFPQRTIDRS